MWLPRVNCAPKRFSGTRCSHPAATVFSSLLGLDRTATRYHGILVSNSGHGPPTIHARPDPVADTVRYSQCRSAWQKFLPVGGDPDPTRLHPVAGNPGFGRGLASAVRRIGGDQTASGRYGSSSETNLGADRRSRRHCQGASPGESNQATTAYSVVPPLSADFPSLALVAPTGAARSPGFAAGNCRGDATPPPIRSPGKSLLPEAQVIGWLQRIGCLPEFQQIEICFLHQP